MIIAAPAPSATSSATSPNRTASRMLADVSPSPRRAAAVNETAVRMMTPPPAASVVDTALSKPVSKLKCDGTPRQACMLTSTVSTTLAAAKTPSNTFRTRARTAMYDVAQATVTSVSPNDRPNVTAFRIDTGPVHEPPDTTSTTACARPLRNRSAPVA